MTPQAIGMTRKTKLNRDAGFIDAYYLIWIDHSWIRIEEFPTLTREETTDGTSLLEEDPTAKKRLEKRIAKILRKEKDCLGDETRILYVIKGREIFYEATKMIKEVKLTNELPEDITTSKQLDEHVSSGIAIQDD